MTEGKLSLMEKSRLFEGLSAMECEKLIKEVNPCWKRFSKGQIVISEGEEISQIGIIKNGALTGVKFYLEGDAHINHMLSEGETFGLEAAASSYRTAPISFTASEEALLLMFDYEKLIAAASLNTGGGVKLLTNVAAILAGQNIKQIYKAEVLSKHSLRGRILTYFHVMETRSGGKSFSIRMNRQEFADYLCVNRSALCTELTRMKNEGIITLKKDKITLLT